MKLRGNSPAKVDEKGRVKIPAYFLDALKEFGNQFYITSPTGESARVYPMQVWSEIEDKLASTPNSAEKRNFLTRTSYYGQVAEMDAQGRVLLPAILRESAALTGDVAVLGNLNYLVVMNDARVVEKMKNEPFTDEQEDALGL
jgi:MraZ protein